jgi:hypothetical protein
MQGRAESHFANKKEACSTDASSKGLSKEKRIQGPNLWDGPLGQCLACKDYHFLCESVDTE